MSDFLLQISYIERETLAIAIACRLHKLQQSGDWKLEYLANLELLRRLLEAPKLSEGQTGAHTPRPVGIPEAVKVAHAAPLASSPEPTAPARDSEIGELTITPTKVEQSQDGKSMVVTFIGAGNRSKNVRCWDPKQFSSLLAAVKSPITLLVKRTDKGFTNIVGVKR